MCTWQYAVTNGDRAHGTRVAAIDAWLAAENLSAHNFSLQRAEQIIDMVLVNGKHFRRHCRHHFIVNRSHRIGARLLGTNRIRLSKCSFGYAGNLRNQGFIRGRSSPIPGIGTHRIGHFVDRLNHDLHLLVTKHHRAQHDFFRQLLRFRFHHLHGTLSTGDDQVHLRSFEFRSGRIEQILTVGITHACRAYRAVERDAGQCQRSRRAYHRRDIGINLFI